MADPQHEPGTGARHRLPDPRASSAAADQRRVIELLRQARGSVAGVEGSVKALRRRVRALEEENARLRQGSHGGAS